MSVQGSGRWREKFITLTLPHSGDIERDIKVLPHACRLFRKELWAHFRLDRGLDPDAMRALAFVRVIEVTPGSKGDGHAHVHFYLLSPFLPKALVRHLWGAALLKLGYVVPLEPMEEVLAGALPQSREQLRQWLVTRRGKQGRLLDAIYAPVIDIEQVYGDVENELVKYLLKDMERDPDGEQKLIAPELFARVYAGLEGVRTVVTSTGFWGKGGSPCKCQTCGSTLTTRERVKPAPENDNSGADHA